VIRSLSANSKPRYFWVWGVERVRDGFKLGQNLVEREEDRNGAVWRYGDGQEEVEAESFNNNPR